MKKSNITINPIENTITISKAFYKKASAYGSAEYAALRGVMLDNPTFEIVFKTIEKKTYKALTFKIMEDYIRAQPDSDKMMIRFAAVKRIAKTKNSLYPYTKHWFLKTFPAFKENEVSEAETETLAAALSAAAEAEAAAKIAAFTSNNIDNTKTAA